MPIKEIRAQKIGESINRDDDSAADGKSKMKREEAIEKSLELANKSETAMVEATEMKVIQTLKRW